MKRIAVKDVGMTAAATAANDDGPEDSSLPSVLFLLVTYWKSMTSTLPKKDGRAKKTVIVQRGMSICTTINV